ncbi:hypothetical protein [Draconibacterium sediminis]|uniref:hypothetical protein n=1 Tax=Draconibacterium sediminis TaxID=1544798 RepID=UPI0026EBF758|nr:hypothetical protein [Draconibacterium sediminis]
MKKLLILLILYISTINFVYSTEQRADFLIIGNDTICLKSFPLEELKFQIRPFKYGDFDFPNTACWRGYQATWKIIDNKLFLTEIIKADSTQEKLDIENYFKLNSYTPQIINGLIYADWFSADLEPYIRNYGNKSCLFISYRPKKSKALIKFEKGVMIENKYKGKMNKNAL